MFSYNSCCYIQPYTGDGSSNGGSSNRGGSRGGGEERAEGISLGGGDNVNGSSDAPTEGIILIVFVLLMMCL